MTPQPCFPVFARLAPLVVVVALAVCLLAPSGTPWQLIHAAMAQANAAEKNVPAVAAYAFLSSLGVNTHVDQGYDANSYVEPLQYIGIRQVRDGTKNIPSDLMIHAKTGVRFTVNAGGNLDGLLTAAKALASRDALLAVEGPNEANNFAISYQGRDGGGPGNSWLPVAAFQRDLYQAVRNDPLLRQYPVFGPSETGAETDNVGLQFLTIPEQAGTVLPAGTQFADYANVHNYVSSTSSRYVDNQAWTAADPLATPGWDGLYGNYGVTWYKMYQGYTGAELPGVPRVTTETGWDTTSNPGGEKVQGKVLTNTYLAQFKRGWRYTFIYELRDGEGSTGEQGLYRGLKPKLSATYIHNLTSILADPAPLTKPHSLGYAIHNEPATVHDLLLQKSTGPFELIVWDERAEGSDHVTIKLGTLHETVRIYDITEGTEPVQTLHNVESVDLTLSDHAMIVEVSF